MSIGERIVTLRTNKGLTQKELGNLVGVTSQQIWKWENSVRIPKNENLQRIANALNLNSDERSYLFYIDDPDLWSSIDGAERLEGYLRCELSNIFKHIDNEFFVEKSYDDVFIDDFVNIIKTILNEYDKETGEPPLSVFPFWIKEYLHGNVIRLLTKEDEPAAGMANPAAGPSSVALVQLRPDESELLDKYNLLNDLGRYKAYEYVSDLTENEKYIQGLEESNKVS